MGSILTRHFASSGINAKGLRQFEQTMATINADGVAVVREFLHPELARWLACSLPGGTIRPGELRRDHPATSLIATVFDVLNRYAATPSQMPPDVFVTRKDGITSHRDKDRTATALICLHTTGGPLVYYYGRPVMVPCTQNTHAISDERSRLDDDMANEFEVSQFSLRTIPVSAGDLVVQGAEVLPSRAGSLSLTHAAKIYNGQRATLGIFGKH